MKLLLQICIRVLDYLFPPRSSYPFECITPRLINVDEPPPRQK